MEQKTVSLNLFGMLEIYSVMVFVTVTVWLIRYRFQRRRLRELMDKMKSPEEYRYPIIGHVTMFLYPYSTLLKKVNEYLHKFGPNFCVWVFNLPLVIIGKPEDLEIVMQSQHCVEKSFFYDFTKEAVGDGLFTAAAGKWKRFRRLIQPTFHSKILKYFLTIFTTTSTICVEEVLPKYENKRDVDWFALFTRTSLDSLCKTAMGIDADAQRIKSEFGFNLHRGVQLLCIRLTNILLYPKLFYMLSNTYREAAKTETFMRTFTEGVLKKKKLEMEKPQNDDYNEDELIRKPFLELLLTIDNDGVPLTNLEILDEIKTLFVGGTDTTSATTCSFFTMMGMHQDIQQRAYEEIMSVLGPDKAMEIDDLAKLNFTERCLKETLRLFSPVPYISRKVCDQEVELTEFTLPVGANLVFPIFYVHRSPKFWKDPMKYDPDRFLPENISKQHPYSFIPFSGGMRNCIGLRYANIHMMNLHCMVLRKYRIYSDNKSIEGIDFIANMATRPSNGFKFYLERRK